MKSCLAQGFPFAFGLRLFTSFDKARENGAVPLPDAADTARKSHGRLILFFSRKNKPFVIIVMHC